MYSRIYGLDEPPFELTADPRFLFLTGRQREALSTLQYGLTSSRSMTLLVGEPGTGKTMLLQAALASERCRNVHVVYVNNPSMRSDEFVRLLAMRFNLEQEAGSSKAVFLERFERYLRNQHMVGEITALVIDEAQALSPELLDEIRLLANIEESSVKLLPLVLAGQPALADRLEDPSLRQVKQRVALRCELSAMTEGETAAYIASRIYTAGGEPSRLFSREAVTLIHRRTGGVPRVINVVCHNALISAMALGGRRVDQAIVAEVCRDLRVGMAAPQAPRVERAASTESSASVPDAEVTEPPPLDEAAPPTRRRLRAAAFTQLFRSAKASNE